MKLKNIAILVPLFKKGDWKVCSHCQGSHSFQVTGEENLADSWTLDSGETMQVSIPVMEQGTGFIPSTGCLRVHGSSPIHMCFVDVEKAFDYVPHGILWEVLQETLC